MIDSLLGLVMLMLLTGWMAGVVSVQAMLSSPARSLAPREQLDLLAAVQASPASPSSCKDLLKTAKSPAVIADLQRLLLAPQLMARGEDQSVAEMLKEQSASGEIPYGQQQDLDKLLRESPQEGEINTFSFDGDWFLQLSQAESGGKNRRERLFLC